VGKKAGGGFLGGLFGGGGKEAAGKLPLLVLHGGPGLPSRYLETLELLAGQGRRVIFYDQVGQLLTMHAMSSACSPRMHRMRIVICTTTGARKRHGMHGRQQIGCGNSFLASEDAAPPPGDIAPGLFLEELAAVRTALGLSQARHHVLGHGWGGMLALDALSHSAPEQRSAVASLALASVPPSYARLVADRRRRVRCVPSLPTLHDPFCT
jgi:pimeloyl-ACP methyl ester carboxylesterase